MATKTVVAVITVETDVNAPLEVQEAFERILTPESVEAALDITVSEGYRITATKVLVQV